MHAGGLHGCLLGGAVVGGLRRQHGVHIQFGPVGQRRDGVGQRLPQRVSAYSTVTGAVACTVRLTRPSRSSLRRVCVSTFA